MKYYKSEKSNTGGFLTTEWTANEMFGANMIEFIIRLAIFAGLSLIASFGLLIVRLYDYEENEKGSSIWGIIISSYFIVDMHYHLVLHFLFTIFTSLDIPFWSRINISILVAHVLLLVFGDTIFYGIDEDDRSRKIYMGLMLIGSIILSYMVAWIFI